MQNSMVARRCIAVGVLAAAALVACWIVSYLTPEPELAVEAPADTVEERRRLAPIDESSPAATYAAVLSDDPARVTRALELIDKGWHQNSPVMLLEIGRFIRNPRTTKQLVALLQKRTGQELGTSFDDWYAWYWGQDVPLHSDYSRFKADFYAQIDARFKEYFEGSPEATIRLDKIRWGGVPRDGIPPLDHPRIVSAPAVSWLDDTNVVFCVSINGETRAYPKRILAWHEMVRDNVGGKEINGVYCTLCGSMIVYDPVIDGQHHQLGTSGFLYQSNKLMYDQGTKSMWSTLTGEPVVGELVGKGLRLKRLPVVTTTWGQWRARHPDTTVLSLKTGHTRDYSEGEAYREYFATDELMFKFPLHDRRLKNKAEILGVRFDDTPEPLALSVDFLAENPLHHEQLGPHQLAVLTDDGGASRVYATGEVRLTSWDGKEAVDEMGTRWTVTEDALTAGDRALGRVPAHRAFWFGWSAAFPDTRLVH